MQNECKNKIIINKIILKNTSRISISYPQWSRHCRRWGLACAQVYCDRDTVGAQGSREHTTISQRHSVEMMESPPRVITGTNSMVVLDSLKESQHHNQEILDTEY